MTRDAGVGVEANGHWMAWQARTAKHERLVRRRFVIAVTALAVIAMAVVVYLLPGR